MIIVRKKIFWHALPPRPSTQGVIKAECLIDVSDADRTVDIAININVQCYKYSATANRQDIYRNVEHSLSDMALLLANKESRKVFLEVFQNSLPTPTRSGGAHGQIRFEDDTIIQFCIHFCNYNYAFDIKQAVDSGYSFSKVFDNVHRIAFEPINELDQLDLTLTVAARFKNLKTITLLSSFCLEEEGDKGSTLDEMKMLLAKWNYPSGDGQTVPDLELHCLCLFDEEHDESCAYH